MDKTFKVDECVVTSRGTGFIDDPRSEFGLVVVKLETGELVVFKSEDVTSIE